MSSSIVPGADPGALAALETTRTHALEHIARGWAVLLLSVDDSLEGKLPFKACERCSPRSGTCRDGTTCECLTCHSFYSATRDVARFDEMLRRHPAGYLAVRTGIAGSRGEAGSHLLVLDAESSRDEGVDVTGLDVLDAWEEWTSGAAGSLPETLIARSVSGGLHVYLRLPNDAPTIGSKTRVLPGVDVKAEGGLVGAVGSRNGKRHWVDPAAPLADAPTALLAWLTRQRGRGRGGRGAGYDGSYDYRRFEREGCPYGHRDPFFNDLLFRLRKADTPLDRATAIAYEHWTRAAQPPEARTRCEWWHIEYKIERVWGDVIPDESVRRAVETAQSWGVLRSDQKVRPLSRNAVITPY